MPNGVKISTCMAAFVMRRFRVEACRKLGVVGVGLGEDGGIGYKDSSRPQPAKKAASRISRRHDKYILILWTKISEQKFYV